MGTLKEIRRKTGLTQYDAAKLCGVSRRTYQTYESKDSPHVLLKMLEELGINEKTPPILNVRLIRNMASEIFAKYEEVRCAYLFGSYARNEATVKSDVDILVVAPTMGLKFYALAADLESALGKKVDLLSYRQIGDNEEFLARLLMEGIKIYGQNINPIKNRLYSKTY